MSFAITNWAGAVLGAIGLWLLYSAWSRRSRALARQAAGEEPPPLHPSLELVGGIVPPIVLVGLAILGAETTLSFFVLEGGRGLFSIFDLIGFWVLLLGYGVWMVCKSKYRLPDTKR